MALLAPIPLGRCSTRPRAVGIATPSRRAGALATPPETAGQELEAWTTGHPFGDRPSGVDVRTAHVAGAGHWLHVGQPVGAAEILTDFLDNHVVRLGK